ncbi:MAG: hypothetical protein KAJ03_08070 [Gammaproteobacteria bacterium]|nr:hypothetical protein [Gammaproteobacteria bacterium]
MRKMLKDIKGQLDINLAITAILGLIISAAFIVIGIIVLQGVVNGASIEAATAATGTLTSTGNITAAEYNVTATLATVNISTETYTFSNVSGSFLVNVASGGNNSSQSIALLVAEINTNSTLVSAVDNGDNTTTVTALIAGVAGNAYISTENATNLAFGAATLAGGTAGDEFSATLTSAADSISSAMILAGTLLLVIVGVAILMLLASVMWIMRRVQG